MTASNSPSAFDPSRKGARAWHGREAHLTAPCQELRRPPHRYMELTTAEILKGCHPKGPSTLKTTFLEMAAL